MNELPYFCHICTREVYVGDDLRCPRCKNDFIELINPVNPPLEEYGRILSFEGGRERGIFRRLGSFFGGRERNKPTRIATDRRNYAVGPEMDDVITRLRDEMEGKKDPASDEEKSKLKRVFLAEDGSCTVCLLPFCEGEPGIVFGCTHVFHEACALAWLEFQCVCPNCRVAIGQEKK
jgi:Ring finger domain/zinc-ribbon